MSNPAAEYGFQKNHPRSDSAGQDNKSFIMYPESIYSENKQETVVSFVLKDPKAAEGTEGKADESEENGYIWTLMFSTLYAIVLILFGLAFPFAEALQHRWLETHAVGIFLTYLFVGSMIFLIYLQVDLTLGSNHEKSVHEEQKDQTSRASPFDSEAHTPVAMEPKPLPKDMLLLRLRKLHPGSRPESPSGSMLNLEKIGNGEYSDIAKLREVSKKSRVSVPTVDLSRTLGERPMGRHRQRSSLPDININEIRADRSTQAHSVPASPQNGRKSRETVDANPLAGQLDGVQSYSTTPRDNTSLILESELCSECDEVYERFVLMEQTASLAHEGASFYLRLGCLLFGVANFVFVALEIHFNMSMPAHCDSNLLIYPHYCQMAFLLVQTYFVLKHTRIHVRRRKGLVRFGLLHVLATNLCIWLRVLTKEVVEAFEKIEHSQHDEYMDAGNSSSSLYAAAGNSSDGCSNDFLHDISPYLFPFVLEYSLIIVAVMAGMFHSLNLRITNDLFTALKKAIQSPIAPTAAPTHAHETTFFSKSHRGLYIGVIFLSVVVVCVILFFYNTETGNYDVAIEIYYWSDIALETSLMVALVIALSQFRHLSITFNRDNSIDDILLMVSLCGLVILQIFILIGSVDIVSDGKVLDYDRYSTLLSIVAAVLNIVQGLVQTAFVMDGLQRCARTEEQQRKKPGRGVVTFLVISNVALWIFKTFQVKELALSRVKAYYGSVAWALILNVSLPFMLFFRFHSSVCLADIWFSAYEIQTGPKYRAL